MWEAFWFFLPAGIANMSPVLANRLPILRSWKTPIDLGMSYRGKRLMGDNKTWRGLLFGTFTGAAIGLIQYRVISSSPESTAFIIAVTAALGFGALFGDGVMSIFKRQRGVAPGKSWFPFDQIDYIIGGLLFANLFIALTVADVLRITIIYFCLHLIFSYIGYFIGVKKTPL
jgi:CDP-2,3-bis-(O-geranylgeranyl)-sn-glycerol synthase